jgi:hypothetical protein
MTTFLRLVADSEKAANLSSVTNSLRSGVIDPRVYVINPDSFKIIPGTPFAYWVSDDLRSLFESLPSFESDGRSVRVGLQTSDDFRFVRSWWEVDLTQNGWSCFAKGGKFSPFYSDIYLVVNWAADGREIKNFYDLKTSKLNSRPQNTEFYRLPGLTWPTRAKRFAPQALGADCIFSQRGFFAYFPDGDQAVALALFNSQAFDYLFKTALGRFGYPEFLVGILQKMPWAEPDRETKIALQHLAHRAWSLKRNQDTVNETVHAFTLPSALRARLGPYDPVVIDCELAEIQAEIDAIAFDLYGFSEADRAAVYASQGAASEVDSEADDDQDDEASDYEENAAPIARTSGLLSWAIGVAFGRFDWRLTTGERAAPPEPAPFDPLPAKSPGMLPDGAAPLHEHGGILVDDQGNPHDLARLIEEVLARVEVPVPEDVRRWLQREFFAFHLQRYSKSRRKAPIYWPLATSSGSYTLWAYYPGLTSQTLYTAINDFVEPKLKQVGDDVTALRNKGSARTQDDEKQFETLKAFELELLELRDTLLKLAPTYKPNHDDGVQISAAPLWPLFRHKPWQKLLKETWTKLEKGDYDWAHLAMNYWPDRVREKCKTDKSLAIAHGLEDLYVEPEAKPKKARGRKKSKEM